jgi:TPP-dependent pyruvate/acetoin dehydrogenase alpha subunit
VRETRDPILILRNRMIEAGFATDEQLKVRERRRLSPFHSDLCSFSPPSDH